MPTNCKHCGSIDLKPRGGGLFRNECAPCINKRQREKYHEDLDKNRARVRASHRKHAVKRRLESNIYAQNNKERRAIIEWFRKKGIKTSELPEGTLDKLTELKKALKRSKDTVKQADKQNLK